LLAVLTELEHLAAAPLWPGFDPGRIPVAVTDGTRTLLARHPRPPDGFVRVALAGRDDVYRFAGRHPALRASTAVDLGGVLTATLLLDAVRPRPVREIAAGAVHEAFHVYQRERHPAWAANEAELFTYPVDDPVLLQLRRLETTALRRALAAAERALAAWWAAAALALRRERFDRLPAGAVAYERGSERNEGLARYVEWRALRWRQGKHGEHGAQDVSRAILPVGEFPAEAVRLRCYAVGQALALLLDRLAPQWAEHLEAGDTRSLDEVLEAAIAGPAGDTSRPVSPFSDRERAVALSRAEAEVQQLLAVRVAERQAFLAAPGWTVQVVAGEGAPLQPQGFDPMNVRRLGPGEVLHTRWIKLGNAWGTVEVLGRRALTEAAGAHPLFTGVHALTVTGIEEAPTVHEANEPNGTSAIRTGDVSAEFRHADVHRDRAHQYLRLDLGSSRP
jgi:hypothetical protein